LWRRGVEEVVSGGHFKPVIDKTRYDTSDLPENQFEPGSDGAVLCNLRGITFRHEMELAETRELLRAGLDLNYEPMRSLFVEIIERCA
jgi:hypothetical protein